MDTSPLFRLCRIPVFTLISLLVLSEGCSHGGKSYSPTGPSPDAMGGNAAPANQALSLAKEDGAQSFQVNLVSDVTTITARRTDMNLLNAWGIAVTPTGILWIAANHSSLAVVYDKSGNSLRAPVSIPTTGSSTGGAPSGDVFNPTSGFPVPGSSSSPGKTGSSRLGTRAPAPSSRLTGPVPTPSTKGSPWAGREGTPGCMLRISKVEQ